MHFLHLNSLINVLEVGSECCTLGPMYIQEVITVALGGGSGTLCDEACSSYRGHRWGAGGGGEEDAEARRQGSSPGRERRVTIHYCATGQGVLST